MARALLAAVLTVSAAAFAQTPPAKPTPSAKPAVSQPQPAPTPTATEASSQTGAATPAPATAELTSAEIQKQVDQKLEEAKRQLREEIKAELATASASAAAADVTAWQQEVTEERRKLELLELDGYFRTRPDLFHKFDLNRGTDPSRPSTSLWPLSPASSRERTVAGVNMRLRLEPTLNVSEEVRLRMQVDALDNLVWGSNPDYAFSRYGREAFGLFTESQVPSASGINSSGDSIVVRRAYGEVSTPVGILRFGRMGSQWGLGLVHNDGNCFDCDYGDTVDRFQFVSEPLAGWFVAPMLDFNSEGPTSNQTGGRGQPFDVTQRDDARTYVLAIARRDTEQQAKAKLENNQPVFNGGLYLSWRTQKSEAADYLYAPYSGEGGDKDLSGVDYPFVPRGGNLYSADAWLKWEQKNFRLEAEFVGTYGQLGSARSVADAANGVAKTLDVWQFGGALQGEYRLLENKLKLGGEIGYASGDRSPGLGNFPGRAGSNNGWTQAGDVDGPQYDCSNVTSSAVSSCRDPDIKNFRFDRDYRIDMILWREILGGVTDAIYVKPTIDYQLADGINLFGAVIYSRTVFAESAPAYSTATGAVNSPDLGLEVNAGARYQTEDGFHFELQWGMLFPLAGLETGEINQPDLEQAQSLRAKIGIRF